MRFWRLVSVLAVIMGSMQHVFAHTEPTVIERKTFQDARFPGRNHTYLRLSNHLKLWLTSDPMLETSGACVVVNAGSASDPKTTPGLAHFLEHMLFINSQKYPEVDGYFKFISEHNGSANAYTAPDHTAFYFEVGSGAFVEALDRLGQFFFAPTFDAAYVPKELKAVDAEHSKNQKNPLWRMMRVGQRLLDPKHPLAQFSTGNSKTLKHAGQEALQHFFTTHYRPDNMQVAVADVRPMAELERDVVALFSKLHLPKTPLKKVDLRNPSPPTMTGKIHMAQMQSLGSETLLSLDWTLPSTSRDYAHNHLDVLASVLGSREKNSLVSELLALQWATDVQVGASRMRDAFDSIGLELRLTPLGKAHVADVLALVQGYVKKVASTGISKSYYAQEKQLAELEFAQSPRPSASSVVRDAQALAVLEPKHLLRGGQVYSGLDVKKMDRALEALNPEHLHVILSDPESVQGQVDPYYGVEYKTMHIAVPSLSLDGETRLTTMTLPSENPYVPTKEVVYDIPQPPFSVDAPFQFVLQRKLGVPVSFWHNVPKHYLSVRALMRVLSPKVASLNMATLERLVQAYAFVDPQRLLLEKGLVTWYKPNRLLKKAAVFFEVAFDQSSLTPEQTVMRGLYIKMLQKHLLESTYLAQTASYHVQMSQTSRGVTVMISGYPEHFQRFVAKVKQIVQGFDLNEKAFYAHREALRQSLASYEANQGAMQRVSQAFHEEIQPYSHSPMALRAVLPGVHFEHFKIFAKSIFATTSLETSCFGNFSPSSCTLAVRTMESVLKTHPLAKDSTASRALKLPIEWYKERLFQTNQSDTGVLRAHSLGTMDPKHSAIATILNKRLGSDFFKVMRTEKNLGYIVRAGVREENAHGFLSFYVQSQHTKSRALFAHVDAYARHMLRKAAWVDLETFEALKLASKDSYLDTITSEEQGVLGLHHRAYVRNEDFHWTENTFKGLEMLTHTDYNAYLDTLTGMMQRGIYISAQSTLQYSAPSAS